MDGFGRKDKFSIVCACIRRYPGGYRIIVGCRMLPQTRNCLCFFAFKRCERRGGGGGSENIWLVSELFCRILKFLRMMFLMAMLCTLGNTWL